MKELTQKAIDAVFEITADAKKATDVDSFQNRLGLNSDFFSFSGLISFNQDKFVLFLDWYFHDLLGGDDWHPEGEFGGLVSYALYDAATPYINGKAYNLKEKAHFEAYVKDSIAEREKNQ